MKFRATEYQIAREMGDMGYTRQDIDHHLDQCAAKHDEDKAMADNNDRGEHDED